MDGEDRDEAINELFQDFYKSLLSDETVERLREGLQRLYPDVAWEDKHIDALKELHGTELSWKGLMEWQSKHGPKDLGKFLSGIRVDGEED